MRRITSKLGKTIYKKYMASPLWEEKKQLYKKTSCEICGTTYFLGLHHLTYDNLGQETLEDLATLCKYCHFAFHNDLATKRKLKKPSRAMAKLLRRIRTGLPLKGHIVDFLRRRYIIVNGDSNLPPYNYFRQQVYQFKNSRENLNNLR